MSSLGNFNASATSFRAENTNAIVNVNFELNLFAKKFVQPPPEYAGVGQHLAPRRLQEAQDGVRHEIARKLGLLFKEKVILASTPQLIKAYGSRASEIARSSAANPQGNDTHGAFAGMIGADATTLWAAATSGWSAIRCHLLACLLARIWEPSEATSIWVEIIAKRKEELMLKLDEEGELDQDVLLVMANEISRSDIRDWDASARAWLRIADSVMARQQTQVRLIVDNLHIPVNLKPDTYESVIDAWTSAMIQMEKLLNGTPIQVHRGDILLGLLSWHLYPDMKYLSTGVQDIKQHDPLFQDRGILSVGLEPSPRIAKDPRSIYWALPLAHLRYYGRLPVTRMRSFRSSETDRISVDEMLWAMTSAYILPWDDGTVPTRDVLQFVSDTATELHRGSVFMSSDSPEYSWLTMLSRVALQHKDRLDEERVRKLRSMGQRFCTIFDGPFQNIFNVSTYLKTAVVGVDDKVKLLRDIAATMSASMPKTNDYEFIIVYRQLYADDDMGPGRRAFKEGFEFATACPEYTLHDADLMQSVRERCHRRWMSPDLVPIYNGVFTESVKYLRMPGVEAGGEEIRSPMSRLQYIKDMGEQVEYLDARSMTFQVHKRNEQHRRRGQYRREAENVVIVHHTSRQSRREMGSDNGRFVIMRRQQGPSRNEVKYTEVFGNLDDIALLRRHHKTPPVIHERGRHNDTEARLTYRMNVQKLMDLFRPGRVDFAQCAREMKLDGDSTACLLGMTFIEKMYKSMGAATVDVRAVQVDFRKALWLNSATKRMTSSSKTVVLLDEGKAIPCIGPKDIDAATCFACIAMMETGSYNINPDEMQSVFAVSAADSLYIASALLRDPAEHDRSSVVQRFTGNIGRAGIAFMVPPREPEIKSYKSIDEWYQYDHKVFDGAMENCFEGTSLHIAFSDASQAVNVDFSGGRDVESYFLETLISVYERQTWIAELDILGSMRSARLIRHFLKSSACKCKGPASSDAKMISIDNFAEMIVPPRQPGIIRAKGNWQARLAAASLCLAKGYKVILKPEHTCWGCLSKQSVDSMTVSRIMNDSDQVVIVL
ncbi:hypothetical protein DL769_004105 [Monosporascus sp. CRB-8-3]|nr:hypothetical protein DL769_004105 [Monosporascus sp. CRB-8-3]